MKAETKYNPGGQSSCICVTWFVIIVKSFTVLPSTSVIVTMASSFAAEEILRLMEPWLGLGKIESEGLVTVSIDSNRGIQ